MRILIIEDEHYAAKRLSSLITKELPDATILEVIDTVEEAVEWFSKHVEPTLLFLDIQLADGLSFQIFDQVSLSCPIIFTTAYDEYALQAFKVNSIDYLLKPIEEDSLRRAINKYQNFHPTNQANLDWKNITKDIFQPKHQYKQRFLIKTGSAYSYLNTNEIKLLFSEDGLSFAYNLKGNKVHIDNTLDKIIDKLDPNYFFKVSRKYILALDSIKQIHPYLNSRLKVDIGIETTDPIIVSRERVKEFKEWIDS